MLLFQLIKSKFIRILIALISFLFVTTPSDSVFASSINYGEAYSGYSSIDLKISVETSFKVIENDLQNSCQNEQNLVDYRNWGIGIEVVAAKGGSNYLYHYTSREAAEAISQQGLKVGRDGFSYLTNKGGLSPLQAQIELALPANRALPNSILRIDASGLSPSLIRRVSGNLPGYGAGGGTEFLFNQHIPANLIKILK